MNSRKHEQPFTHGPNWLMLFITKTRQSDWTECTELKKKVNQVYNKLYRKGRLLKDSSQVKTEL
jgi:thiamine biosynthesis lipoprotein ApbE